MSNNTPPDYTSRAPQYTFAETLDAQQAELAGNPMMERFRQSRASMAADPYRPVYHFVSPESRLNDPNGLCFWQGQWHLFEIQGQVMYFHPFLVFDQPVGG